MESLLRLLLCCGCGGVGHAGWRRRRRCDARGRRSTVDRLRFDQYRNYSTSHKAKLPMTKDSQESADCPRMACERNICTLVMIEYVVKQRLQAGIKSRISFTNICFPQWIVFGKTSFELVFRVLLLNPGLATSAVAGVDADSFTKQLDLLSTYNRGYTQASGSTDLLDHWSKWPSPRDIQARERDVCGFQTSG